MAAPQNVVFDLLQRVLSFPAKHPNVTAIAKPTVSIVPRA